MTRCAEPGYVRIGVLCSAGRRSLWLRWPEGGAIELCAGREGDDAHVRILIDDPLYGALRTLLAAAEFAAECPRCGSLPVGVEPRPWVKPDGDWCSACAPGEAVRA